MICPICKGGKTLLKKVQGKGCYEVVLGVCDKCHGTGEVKDNLCETCGTICPFDDKHSECDNYTPLTNEGWLRTATTEQLAEFLADKCNEVVEVVLSDASCDIDDIDNDDYWYRQADFVEWLKQPHTKE